MGWISGLRANMGAEQRICDGLNFLLPIVLGIVEQPLGLLARSKQIALRQ